MEKLGGCPSDIYIDSLISLTSKGEIRYEGVLFTLDTEKSTIVLKDVQSFGTEGRGNNILQIPASDKVYDYIIFRDTDIKDLKVLSFSQKCDNPVKVLSEGVSHPPNVKEVRGKANGHSPELGLGWQQSPQLSGLQLGASWPWYCPPAASRSNGMQPHQTSPLATISQGLQREIVKTAATPSLQGNHGFFVLHPQEQHACFEQVPAVSSTRLCSTQKVESQQQLPRVVSASGQRLVVGNNTAQQSMLSQGKHMKDEPLDARPLSEKPLLPLPVSEIEHRRLIKRSMCSGNLKHLGRERGGWRGRGRGTGTRRGSLTRTCSEVTCPTQKFSKDFDFEAMNEQFNKKEVWQELKLKEHKAVDNDGEQNDASDITCKNKMSMCGSSKKPLFADNFFDLLSRDDLDCKENGAEQTKFSKQLQIDTETFGSFPSRSLRSGRGGHRQGGLHRGALYTGYHIFTMRHSHCTSEAHLPRACHRQQTKVDG